MFAYAARLDSVPKGFGLDAVVVVLAAECFVEPAAFGGGKREFVRPMAGGIFERHVGRQIGSWLTPQPFWSGEEEEHASSKPVCGHVDQLSDRFCNRADRPTGHFMSTRREWRVADARKALRNVPILADIGAKQLNDLASVVDRQHIGAYEWLFRLGEPSDAIYVIDSGRFAAVGADGQVIREMAGGDSIGDLGVISGSVRSAGVQALLEESGAFPEETIIIGDSNIDILTARNAGIYSVGVTYGLAPHTLEDAPPDVLIAHPKELALVLGAREQARLDFKAE